MIIEYQPACSDLSSLQGFISYFTKQIPEVAKVCSPEVQGRKLALHPPCCTKVLKLHHSMATAAKAVPELHLLHQPFLLAGNKVQHNTSPHCLLYDLEQEVLSPPALLMPSYVVPPRTRACEDGATPL